MRDSPTSAARETDAVWHELGLLYALAGEDVRKATMLGSVVFCVTAAVVLISAPASLSILGGIWAGPFGAALVPILAGSSIGGGFLGWRSFGFRKRRRSLGRILAAAGEEVRRPTANGLGSYYDTHLILLRCQYHYLLARYGHRAPRSIHLLEEAFGFQPTDGFECGPLNVAPDTPEMRQLRELWDSRLATRQEAGKTVPAMGLKEDRVYRVFPREMTVPMELATRSAYLSISCRMLADRYGEGSAAIPQKLRHQAEKDRWEYAKIARR